MALTKFKHCAVDVNEIRFVSKHKIVLKDGNTVEAVTDEFSDVAEFFDQLPPGREAADHGLPGRSDDVL